MSIRLPDRTTVLFTLFLAALIVASSTRSPLAFALYAGLAVLLVLSNLEAFTRLDARERTACWLLVGTMTVVLPVAVLRYEVALAHFVVGAVSLLCALVASRRGTVLTIAMRVTLVTVQVGLIAYCLKVGFAAAPLTQILAPHTSANGVTSTLVILQASYSVMSFVVARRTTPITALVTTGVCVLGYGRGSILAAALVLMVNVAFSLSWSRPWRTALILGAILVGGISSFSKIAEYVTLNTKIGVGFEDAPREKMIQHYLARMDGLDAIFGADYRGTAIEEDFLGNPHNSFIRAHHLFGLFYLVGLAAFALLMLRMRQYLRVQIFIGMMLLVVLARAFTEPILFPTLLDFYFFTMCLALSIAESPQDERGAVGSRPAVTTP